MSTSSVPRRPVTRLSARPPAYDRRNQPVALRSEEARAEFITKTYLHLFGAILAFTLLETAYFVTGLARPIAMALLGTSWLLVLGGFVLVSWLASRVAHVAQSPRAQYAALGAYVVAESLIFVPAAADRPGHRARGDPERGPGHALRLHRPDRGRVRDAQGLLVRRGPARLVRRGRPYSSIVSGRRVRLRAGHLLLGRDDRPRRRGDPPRHVEGPPPLPRGPLRGGRRSSCSPRSP